MAVGGTFDQIHAGHKLLLAKAFDSGNFVYIGLTTDQFARKEGKMIEHDYEEREQQLRKYLNTHYAPDRYRIRRLDGDFGEVMYTSEVEAIVVSPENESKVKDVNEERRKRQVGELAVEVVPFVVAYDGRKISSTRIRAGEIDTDGRKLDG